MKSFSVNNLYIPLLLIIIFSFFFSCSTEKKEKIYSSNFEKHKDSVVIYKDNFSVSKQNNFTWGIKNISNAMILELCYGGTYNPLYQATLWTPLLGDAAEFEAWTDDKHINPTIATGITNIYNMKKNGNEQAIVIFKTSYEWVENIADSIKETENKKRKKECADFTFNMPRKKYFSSCPTGIAIFEKDFNNIWILTHFNRNIGSPGLNMFEPLDSVFQIGAKNISMNNDDSSKKPIWAINFHEFSLHSNSDYTQNSIYIPISNTIKKVITLEEGSQYWLDINCGWRGTPRDRKNIEQSYKFVEPRDENSSGIKNILVNRTGLDYDENTKKSFKVNKKILYQWDVEKEEYTAANQDNNFHKIDFNTNTKLFLRNIEQLAFYIPIFSYHKKNALRFTTERIITFTFTLKLILVTKRYR